MTPLVVVYQLGELDLLHEIEGDQALVLIVIIHYHDKCASSFT
jgi:hypothetical protein